MITTFIVDDEQKNIQLLELYLEKFCPQINLVGSSTTIENTVKKINELKPTLLFLDVMLEHGTSFQIIDQLQYQEVLIVFVTAHTDFAINAIKYNATDYLVKPVNKDNLIETVTRVSKKIQENKFTEFNLAKKKQSNFDFITVPTHKKIDFIKTQDIIYLEAQGRYTTIYKIDGSNILASKNIGEFEKTMNMKVFFRIHHKYLINVGKIKNLFTSDGFYCEMDNNITLSIAKRRKEALLQFLNLK